MRCVLVDTGHFRLDRRSAGRRHAVYRSPHVAIAAMMLDDLKLDTADFAPNYDERSTEPTVLPSRFPNLLVNGCRGSRWAYYSIPPITWARFATRWSGDRRPDVSIDELLKLPGPRLPDRRDHLRTDKSGRLIIRDGERGAPTRIEEVGRRHRIIVSEIPYQGPRRGPQANRQQIAEDRIRAFPRFATTISKSRSGWCSSRRRRRPDVAQPVYQLAAVRHLSLIFLALVDGKPRCCRSGAAGKFLRHRLTVIRRRTQHLLSKARQRKHTVEGLLLAHVNIDG